MRGSLDAPCDVLEGHKRMANIATCKHPVPFRAANIIGLAGVAYTTRWEGSSTCAVLGKQPVEVCRRPGMQAVIIASGGYFHSKYTGTRWITHGRKSGVQEIQLHSQTSSWYHEAIPIMLRYLGGYPMIRCGARHMWTSRYPS